MIDAAARVSRLFAANELYRAVLGPDLVYSCAAFRAEGESLDIAQRRKLEQVCETLGIGAEDRLLDLGCGWGSLAIHAVERHSAKVVGITISDSQALLARHRVHHRGISTHCEIRHTDYRDLEDGLYDKIASIELSERLHRPNLGDHLSALRRLLRPGGLLLVHVVASRSRSRRVRPWRLLDSGGASANDWLDAHGACGLRVVDNEASTFDYTVTLHKWLQALDELPDELGTGVGWDRVRDWQASLRRLLEGFEGGELELCKVLSQRDHGPCSDQAGGRLVGRKAERAPSG